MREDTECLKKENDWIRVLQFLNDLFQWTKKKCFSFESFIFRCSSTPIHSLLSSSLLSNRRLIHQRSREKSHRLSFFCFFFCIWSLLLVYTSIRFHFSSSIMHDVYLNVVYILTTNRIETKTILLLLPWITCFWWWWCHGYVTVSLSCSGQSTVSTVKWNTNRSARITLRPLIKRSVMLIFVTVSWKRSLKHDFSQTNHRTAFYYL